MFKRTSAQPLRRKRSPSKILLLVPLVLVLAGCPNGAGTPAPGAKSHGKCSAGLAPDDVTKPADNCGVAALNLPFPVTLPHIQIQPMEIDLYIQSQTSCATSSPLPDLGCGIDDNRPFVNQGSLDPHAHASRNRVHIILDFNAGLGTFTISPSCRIHPIGGVGSDNQKECFAPKQLNEGTSLNVTKDLTNSQSWVITISSVVVQTNYPAVFGPVEPGQVHNDWTLKIDPASGAYTLTGSGSAFPDFAVISDNHVECAAQGTNLTRLGGGPNRDYTNCAGLAPLLYQTPTASPSPSPTAVCPSHVFQSLVLVKYGPAVRAAGKATCAGTYALQDFTPYAGGQQAQFFFIEDASRVWRILEGGNAIPTIACQQVPRKVLTQLGALCPPAAYAPTVAPSPTASARSGCNAAIFLKVMKSQGSTVTGTSGPPTCVGTYAEQNFTFPHGPTSNYPTYFFYHFKGPIGWAILGGGSIGSAMTECKTFPPNVLAAFALPTVRDSGCPSG